MTRKPLGTHRSFADLMADFDLLIPPARLAKWRLLFPNVGQLDGFPHFGNVMICATDGLEAYYHIGTQDFLWKGHLKAFNGPIAKVYVWEEDWDFVARKRKVNVFRRADGSYAIIPRDHFWESYWEKHSRMPEWEKDLYAQTLSIDGMVLRRGNIRFSDLDEAIRVMSERSAQPKAKTSRNPVENKRKQILASL